MSDRLVSFIAYIKQSLLKLFGIKNSQLIFKIIIDKDNIFNSLVNSFTR